MPSRRFGTSELPPEAGQAASRPRSIDEYRRATRSPDVTRDRRALNRPADAHRNEPLFLLSLAGGYPVGIKQFLQFCLILSYPAWLFTVLASAALYYTVYATLWALFWPLRVWMKRNRPDDYAASQRR
ncbi:hypothetical protein A4G26_08600 [Mycobacterium kansasii]|nr:hypothetical protein A4G26_08600 [Mycobacterium kansasii]